jgi:alpha-galactosidase
LLCTCGGDKADDLYSYQPQEHRLNNGTTIGFEPFGGRPTNLQFPYYRLVSPAKGVFISVGWPGQWKTCFLAKNGSVHFTAGQASFDAYLQPGEEIRTPLISLLFHDPDSDDNRAANLWRRWFMDCNMRKIEGGAMPPVLAGLTSFLYDRLDVYRSCQGQRCCTGLPPKRK